MGGGAVKNHNGINNEIPLLYWTTSTTLLLSNSVLPLRPPPFFVSWGVLCLCLFFVCRSRVVVAGPRYECVRMRPRMDESSLMLPPLLVSAARRERVGASCVGGDKCCCEVVLLPPWSRMEP